MTETYFELAYYRDFVIPAILAGICLVALVIYVIAHYISIVVNYFRKKWDDKNVRRINKADEREKYLSGRMK